LPLAVAVSTHCPLVPLLLLFRHAELSSVFISFCHFLYQGQRLTALMRFRA
jgi:hypothetical protein